MADYLKYQILDADRFDSASSTYIPYYPKSVLSLAGQVDPLIDGKAFFNDLYATMESLSGDFTSQHIFLMHWTFNKQFLIQPGLLFTDYLKTKAAAGVDVRVLIWVNEFIAGTALSWNTPLDFGFNIPPYLLDKFEQGRDWLLQDETYWTDLMVTNLETLVELRTEPALAEKALANTLDCPIGSSHSKFALVFDQSKCVCYTGGMDYEINRISDSIHYADPNGWNNSNGWHDIQARVTGEITQDLFDFYQQMWNELVNLKNNAAQLGYTVPTFLLNGTLVVGTPPGAPTIPAQVMPFSGTFNHYVQSLRTLPDKTSLISPFAPPDSFDFTFAPSGAYEIQLAVKKAIANAETYIYIEDQAMLSREILGYLKDAVKAKPNLKVILVTGQMDPDVPQTQRNFTIPYYFLQHLTQAEKDRVVFYIHNVYVHSKLFLIDDKFAVLGSAGLYNRALFVEIEHSISFVDQDPATESIKQFRQDLWAEHFKLLPAEKVQIQDISIALCMWNPAWGASPPSFKLPFWAQSLSELPSDIRTLDSVDIPVGLVPYNVIKVNTVGAVTNVVPGTSNIFTNVTYQNDPALINQAGVDFIEDLALPLDTVNNLTGLWIRVVAGPTDGSLLRITAHSGIRITLTPLPTPHDNTTTYRIYKPFIQKVDLANIAMGATALFTFENQTDCGGLP